MMEWDIRQTFIEGHLCARYWEFNSEYHGYYREVNLYL